MYYSFLHRSAHCLPCAFADFVCCITIAIALLVFIFIISHFRCVFGRYLLRTSLNVFHRGDTRSTGEVLLDTQTQTNFIQHKWIQVPYQVYMHKGKIQITVYPWYIMKHRHVRRPPLRSDLTASMEATRRGKACTAMLYSKQLHINWITNSKSMD